MRMTAGLFIFSLLFILMAQAENTTFDMALPEAESQGPSSNNFVNSFQNDLGNATSKSYESSTSYQTAPAAVPPAAEEVKGGYESAFSSYHSKKSLDEGEVEADDWRKGQEKLDSFDLENMTYTAPVKNTVQSAIQSVKSRAPASVPEDDVAPASAKARKTMVMKTISDNYDELKTCYHDGLKNSSEMKGKVVMGWNMDTQGRVSGVEVLASQLNNKQVEKCMTDRLAGWSFPRQAKLKGNKDRMTYTFQFVTEKE